MSPASHHRSDAPELAPEVPGLGRAALSGLANRPGFAILIPGECLKPDSKLWSDEQRERGVWVKGIFLSASEEEACIVDAGREGKLAAIGLYNMRRSLHAIADPIAYDDPEAPDGKGRGPGSWSLIPTLDRRAYWEDLGAQGRGVFATAYQLANSPSQAAQEVALKSFRSVA